MLTCNGKQIGYDYIHITMHSMSRVNNREKMVQLCYTVVNMSPWLCANKPECVNEIVKGVYK